MIIIIKPTTATLAHTKQCERSALHACLQHIERIGGEKSNHLIYVSIMKVIRDGFRWCAAAALCQLSFFYEH